jgi:hypothetical protein
MKLYHGPSIEQAAPHLLVEIVGAPGFVVDVAIRQTDRKTPIWHVTTHEFWTPLSIPLVVTATLGAKNGLQIWSVKTKLLEVGLADMRIDVSLRLPSEEVLHARIEQRSRLFQRTALGRGLVGG